MQLFHFLKSTHGAIKPLNALLISGAAGALFAYTVGTVSDKQIEAERQVRTLSSISAGSAQKGKLFRDGQLTSINVGDSQRQLATAEERAAMQRGSALEKYMANQRALEGMDSALGRAAQFVETDGLNTANRDVSQIPGQFVPGTSVDTGEGVAGAVTRATPTPIGKNDSQGGVGNTPQPTLVPATMARASGSNSGSASGPISGGTVGSTRGNTEGMRLSGAMPGGSNLLSQRGLDKGSLGNAGTSAFRQGRDGYITRGPNSQRGKNELEDIAKRSARAAASKTPSANEGAQAFLAGVTRSGGVVVDPPTEEGPTSSEDLKNPSATKLKAIGNHLQGVEDDLEERQSANRALKWQMILTILGTIGAMVAGSLLLSRLDLTIKNWEFEASVATLPADKAACEAMVKMFKLRRLLTGIAFMTAVTAASAFLFYKASQFISNYGNSGGTGMATACKWIAPILVGGMLFTVIAPKTMKGVFGNIWKQMKGALSPIGMVTNTAKNALMGALFK